MDYDEFLEDHGAPGEMRAVSEGEIARAQGRLPPSLIDFWREHGIGTYADSHLRLCTPDLFDPILDRLLANVPHLRGRLAAFAYFATGQIYLWHPSARLFVLYLPEAWIDDQTSHRETDPVPHDLAETYAAAGVSMPEDAASIFLEQRGRPEDIWTILYHEAWPENFSNDLGDDGAPLPAGLKSLLGSLQEGKIYAPKARDMPNVAASFEVVGVNEFLRRLPETVTISRMVEHDGFRESIEETYQVGSGP